MKLIQKLRDFLREEDGAVTVDWVVLTAAVVAMGMIVLGQVRTGADALAGKVSTYLTGLDVVEDAD